MKSAWGFKSLLALSIVALSGCAPQVTWRNLSLLRQRGSFSDAFSLSGIISTVTGLFNTTAGIPGYYANGGDPTDANLSLPYALTTDPTGNIYIADSYHGVVRMIPKVDGTYFGIPMLANKIHTIAGNGDHSYSGDGGPATDAAVNLVFGLAIDSAGRLFLADMNNNVIRMVPNVSGTYRGSPVTAGYIYTIAGTTAAASTGDGGPATAATFNSPAGVSVDSLDNVYISDFVGCAVRMIPTASGTYYGVAMTAGYVYKVVGDGTCGFAGDGGASISAQMNTSYGTAIDSNDNLYIADTQNRVVRMVPQAAGTYFGIGMNAGSIYTIGGTAGSSGYSGDGGVATSGQIGNPRNLAVDAGGNVYVADSFNNVIRVIAATNGNYYGVATNAGHLQTVAGTGATGYSGDGGPALSAEFDETGAVTIDPSGNLIIADSTNNVIRIVPSVSGTYFGAALTANYVYPFAGGGTIDYLTGDGGAATDATLYGPTAVALDADDALYVADSDNNAIRMIPKTSGTYFGIAMNADSIYTIAGDGTNGFSGDGGAATSAQLGAPRGVAVDSAGNLYIGDTDNSVIRMVPRTSGTYFGIAMNANSIYTIAGDSVSPGYSGDGGLAINAEVDSPMGLFVDAGGNLYIADAGNNVIRMIAASAGTHYGVAMLANRIYTIAGTGVSDYTGDGGAALSADLKTPGAIAVDSNGLLAIADVRNNVVRAVPSTTGTYLGIAMTANFIYTVAGTGVAGSAGDGGVATIATLNYPDGVAFDSRDALVIGSRSQTVRLIPGTTGTYFGTTLDAGKIYSVAGDGVSGYSGDAGLAVNAHISKATGVAFGSDDTLYFSDGRNNVIRKVTP